MRIRIAAHGVRATDGIETIQGPRGMGTIRGADGLGATRGALAAAAMTSYAWHLGW